MFFSLLVFFLTQLVRRSFLWRHQCACKRRDKWRNVVLLRRRVARMHASDFRSAGSDTQRFCRLLN